MASPTTTIERPTGELFALPIDQLVMEGNVRSALGDLAGLVESIKAHGVLEPVLVTPRTKDGKPTTYLVVAGHRRVAAASAAGLTHIPAVVRETEEQARVAQMLVENLHRDDLPIMDEARGYKRLIDDGLSQRGLSPLVGKSQAHISKRLALLDLPEEAQKAVDSGGISVTDGLALTQLKDDPDRVATALKQGQRYGDVRREVERELEGKKRAEGLAAAIAQAEADPAPYIEAGPSQYDKARKLADLPGGSVALGKEYGRLNITAAKHRKEPCHAITVIDKGWEGAKLTYICTNPKAHPDALKQSEGIAGAPRGSKLSDSQKAERAKAREQGAALRAAEKGRREFIAELLKKPVTAEDALVNLVGHNLASYRGVFDGMALASTLLGLDTPEPENQYDNVNEKVRKVLVAFAMKSKANLARLAMALVLADVETGLDPRAHSWTYRESVTPHFEILASHGYTVSPAERKMLPKPARKSAAVDGETA